MRMRTRRRRRRRRRRKRKRTGSARRVLPLLRHPLPLQIREHLLLLHLLLVLLSHPSRHLVMLREVRHLLRRVLLHLRLPHLRVVRLLVMRPVVVFILRLHPLLHLLLVVKPVLLLLREEVMVVVARVVRRRRGRRVDAGGVRVQPSRQLCGQAVRRVELQRREHLRRRRSG